MAVFYIRGMQEFALAVIYTLSVMEILSVLFQSVFFCKKNGSTMLANLVMFMLCFLAQVGIMLAWGIWIIINRDVEDLNGCPICGEKKTRGAMFYFSASYVAWFIVILPIKIASWINF